MSGRWPTPRSPRSTAPADGASPVKRGTTFYCLRHDEARVSHLLVAALLGAQISTTGVAAEVNTVFAAANHLLSTVFT